MSNDIINITVIESPSDDININVESALPDMVSVNITENPPDRVCVNITEPVIDNIVIKLSEGEIAGTALTLLTEHKNAYNHENIQLHINNTTNAHALSSLTEDTNHRLVTDDEKNIWNCISGVTGYTGSSSGMGWVAKNSTYEIVKNQGVLADTSTIAWTLTLPLNPNIGDVVGVSDSVGFFNTNNLTINRNGNLIHGLDEDLICNMNDVSFHLIYNGPIKGWKLDNYLSQGYSDSYYATILSFNNQIMTSWTSNDATVPSYPYRGTMILSNVTQSDKALVTPSISDIIKNELSSICETYDGGIYMYSKTGSDVTLDNILIIKNV